MSLRLALALTFLLTLIVSVASWPLHLYGSDPFAVREEARALILTGSLDVATPPAPPPAPLDRPGEYFVQNTRTNAWVSKYGLFSTLAVIPPLAVEYLTTGELPPLDSRDRTLLLNAWNTVLTLLLAAVLVRLASLYTARAWLMTAFALTTLFSTFVWNYARAQAPEIVQILLAAVAADQLLRHLRSPSNYRLLAVYAAVAALVLSRVYFVTLLPVVAVALLAHRRDRSTWIAAIVGTAAVLALLAAANVLKFGSPLLTGYHAFLPERHLPTGSPLPALYGFLISAQKGIFWHFPTLLLALLGAAAFARRYRSDAILLGAGIVFCFFPLCFIPTWAGEWAYGPRYLVFALPLLALPAVDLLDHAAGKPRIALLTLGAALALTGTYLTYQVNRVDFFTANTLRGPLLDLAAPSQPTGWQDDTVPYPGRDYFDTRPWGLIVRDLFASQGRLERHPLAPTARRELSAAAYEDFRRLLWNAHQNTNWWWLTSGKRFNERRFDLPPDWEAR